MVFLRELFTASRKPVGRDKASLLFLPHFLNTRCSVHCSSCFFFLLFLKQTTEPLRLFLIQPFPLPPLRAQLFRDLKQTRKKAAAAAGDDEAAAAASDRRFLTQTILLFFAVSFVKEKFSFFKALLLFFFVHGFFSLIQVFLP